MPGRPRTHACLDGWGRVVIFRDAPPIFLVPHRSRNVSDVPYSWKCYAAFFSTSLFLYKSAWQYGQIASSTLTMFEQWAHCL